MYDMEIKVRIDFTYHSWQVIFWRSLVSNEATASTMTAGQMSSEPGIRLPFLPIFKMTVVITFVFVFSLFCLYGPLPKGRKWVFH